MGDMLRACHTGRRVTDHWGIVSDNATVDMIREQLEGNVQCHNGSVLALLPPPMLKLLLRRHAGQRMYLSIMAQLPSWLTPTATALSHNA